MEGNRCAATLSGLLTEMWTACREGVDPAVEEPVEGCGRRYPGHVIRGLVLACHPLPTLAVTAFATGYAATVGLRGGRLLLLAAAVLTGQLVIGWGNDAVDAGRDAARPAGPTSRSPPGSSAAHGRRGGRRPRARGHAPGCRWHSGPGPGCCTCSSVGCGLAYDLGAEGDRRRARCPTCWRSGRCPRSPTTAAAGRPMAAGRGDARRRPARRRRALREHGPRHRGGRRRPASAACRSGSVRGLAWPSTAVLVGAAAVVLLAALPPGAGPVALLASGLRLRPAPPASCCGWRRPARRAGGFRLASLAAGPAGGRAGSCSPVSVIRSPSRSGSASLGGCGRRCSLPGRAEAVARWAPRCGEPLACEGFFHVRPAARRAQREAETDDDDADRQQDRGRRGCAGTVRPGRHPGALAAGLGRAGAVPQRPPGRPAAARSTSWTCSRTPPATCTWVTPRRTRWATSSRATGCSAAST